MPLQSEIHEKIMSAYQLLQGGSISVSTFEHIRTLIKGIHPEIDNKLEICSKALDKLQKIQSGDIITLSVEGLSEDTEEKKKQKKALLFFINSLKNLKSEIKRVQTEFSRANKNKDSLQNQLTTWGKIIRFSKGPFGIITLFALVMVAVLFLRRNLTRNTLVITPKSTITPTIRVSNPSMVQIIIFDGKQIPLSQLYVGHGSDCDGPHYHAKTGSVTALDGTVIPDPENCGYGKIKDVQIMEVAGSISKSP